MPTSYVENGELNITQVASRIYNGSWERFTEIYDLNPNLDIFDDIIAGTQIIVPEIEKIANLANPVLDTVSRVSGIDTTGLKNDIAGYAKEALSGVAEVNGLLKGTKADIVTELNKVREYKGKLVKLVPWLLEGK